MMISVLVACRNEELQIGKCLESILANDYPRECLEVLVIDGMSTDRTRELVMALARHHGSIRLLDNPRQITAAAFNIGIRESRGEIILIMSAHARYAPNYVSACIRHLREYSADDVGGSMITLPDGSGAFAKGVAAVLSHPLGVGNAHFRLPLNEPVWADTVFGGCYRREVFTRIGLFDERLVRGWDMDFNSRLRRSGGRILLVPSIKVWYIPKGGLCGFIRQNFRDGIWAIRAIRLAGRRFQMRHFVPLAFVCVLIISGLLGFVWSSMLWVLKGALAVYGVAAAVSAIQLALRETDASLAAVAPFLFALRHVSYGCGSLIGLLISLFPAAEAGIPKSPRRSPSRSS